MNGRVIYSLPIAYPDLAIGPILYCKRLSTNLFYDYGRIKFNENYYGYSSVGFDLNANLNFFGIILPFEMGLRCSYLIEKKSYAIEFLLFGVAF
jgi:hypothetical protein